MPTPPVVNSGGITRKRFLRGSDMATTPAASPPSRAQAGDLWIYKGSNFFWQFMYDPTETTYKWKFVGGPPLFVDATGTENTSGSITFTNPAVTVPRSGEYKMNFHVEAGTVGNVSTPTVIQWHAEVTDVTAGGVQVGGVSTVNFWAAATGIPYNWPMAITDADVTLTANHVLRIFIGVSGWDVTSVRRTLSLTPLRIS